MTDTADAEPEEAPAFVVPDWLVAAEEALAKQRLEDLGARRRRAEGHALMINNRLERLGITPEYGAAVDDSDQLRPAKLVGPDYEAGTYEVRAAWDEASRTPTLLTADWEADRPEFGFVGLLRSAGDVAEARRKIPEFPEPTRDLHREALRGTQRAIYTSDESAQAICERIDNLTIAVLHLAEAIAQA
ncbi:hypothetical protein [Streptomyces antibioticus]|uniref:hypothetical protein n=1 Tax=Streptomyces antibioticus TaxID=1890 RepID=UPI003D75AC1B